MPRGSYLLRDATDDPSARERANHAPELREALTKLGFYSIGIIEAVLERPDQAASMFNNIHGVDAEKMAAIVRQGEAVEITASRDALMFGVTERTVAKPVISLQTIFDNGIVVETTMRPERAPQPTDRGIFAWLLRWIVGAPPIWPRANSPASGFFVELVETRDSSVLYERHLARLKDIRARYHTTIPRQDSLEVYRAIRLRFRQVVNYQAIWAHILGFLIAVAMTLSIFLVPKSASLMDILFILYACALCLLAIGLVNRVIVPEMGIRPKSLKKLLRQQEAEWGSLRSSGYL